jgi:hypothetical protein
MEEPKETNESRELNWVERRGRRKRLLHAETPELWNRIRGAIQDACATFNRLYAPDVGHNKVFCDLANGHRLRIHRILPPITSFDHPKNTEAIVTFDEAGRTVTVTFESGSHTFYIDIENESVFIAQDRAGTNKLTPDEISQRALEVILFPTS